MAEPDRTPACFAALGLAVLALTLTAADGTLAETTASAPAREEIVVTAQKRDERLPDVAVAISGVSGSDLAAGRWCRVGALAIVRTDVRRRLPP
jgi:outer membrane receptor protein involved in Fe transport